MAGYLGSVDEVVYTVSFTDFLGDGETVDSASVTSSPAGLTITSVTASGSGVNMRIAGGTAGVTYEVECEGTLSTTEVVNRRGRLKVRDL